MSIRFFQSKRAFTLIEVVATIVLLSLSILTMVGILRTSVKIQLLNEQKVAAINLVQTYIEAIKRLDYRRPDDAAIDLTLPEADNRFTLTVEQSEPFGVAYNDYIKKVRVIAQWDSPFGSEEVSLSTYIANITTIN